MASKTQLCLIDRHLSWLSFNHRVLQEAADAGHPVLERLRFLAIFSSNLDEFLLARTFEPDPGCRADCLRVGAVEVYEVLVIARALFR